MKNMKLINNTVLQKEIKENGELIKAEVYHHCLGDVFHTVTKKDIEEGINIICMLCNKDIIIFDKS